MSESTPEARAIAAIESVWGKPYGVAWHDPELVAAVAKAIAEADSAGAAAARANAAAVVRKTAAGWHTYGGMGTWENAAESLDRLATIIEAQ